MRVVWPEGTGVSPALFLKPVLKFDFDVVELYKMNAEFYVSPGVARKSGSEALS